MGFGYYYLLMNAWTNYYFYNFYATPQFVRVSHAVAERGFVFKHFLKQLLHTLPCRVETERYCCVGSCSISQRALLYFFTIHELKLNEKWIKANFLYQSLATFSCLRWIFLDVAKSQSILIHGLCIKAIMVIFQLPLRLRW